MTLRRHRTELARNLGLGLVLLTGLYSSAHAKEGTQMPERTLAIGVLAHDRGPLSDHHENGVDLNLEAQFAPLGIFGSPRPQVGVTANFGGETSAAYAGLNFRFRDTPRWFTDGFLGVAVHNGPLHKDPVRCAQFSDCGFGTRFLPRFGLELGYRVNPAVSISLLFDHMSHKWIVEGENEGLDHIGLRYIRAY